MGDTADMQTANAAAMYPLGALWGFRKAEELLAAGQGLVACPGRSPQLLAPTAICHVS